MQLSLVFYQQMSVPMLCCILHGNCTVQDGSPTCPRSHSNLVEGIGRDATNPYFPVLHYILPSGLWIGARYPKAHSPGWIVCSYIQCSSVNKSALLPRAGNILNILIFFCQQSFFYIRCSLPDLVDTVINYFLFWDIYIYWL